MADCAVIDKELFEHIKSGGPCPLSDRLISAFQAAFDSRVHNNHCNMSSLLAQILDEQHGTEEIVNDRRKVTIINDYALCGNADLQKWFIGGSKGEGFVMENSDLDLMEIQTTVVVTYPDQIHLIPRDSLHKTILLMRKADSRPGYVTLELSKLADGERSNALFQNAIVPFRDSLFVSSDIYRQGIVDMFSADPDIVSVSNGPCRTSTWGHHGSFDVATAFPCVCWPTEANEWIHRTRFHGWPTQTMIDRIVQNGCHLVAVGAKCSTDTLLQWRISFACAERLLVHSLTHPQFRVYGLLKYFLTQIKESLDHIIGDSDIICSYFLKTIIFYAVENSPVLFWNEHNTFICFRFCLSILIAWVKSGYCPNYFIRNNNMFLRKVHGENRHKLLHFLIDFYNLKWMCLCLDSVNGPYIGAILQQQQQQYQQSRPLPECVRDIRVFKICLDLSQGSKICLHTSLKFLHVARTDVDKFIADQLMVITLFNKACGLFNEYTTARSNKQKYIVLKKCKQLLTPHTSMYSSPGHLILGTIHYITGTYRKTLQMCADVISTYRLFIDISRPIQRSPQYYEPYQRLYCGKGYTYWEKIKGTYCCVIFTWVTAMLCPPHLHLEVTKYPLGLTIPPLPYAQFLSFLCYHELGDLRRRDTELINLRAANYHPEQGGHRFWIVHTMLGVCYQTVGDNLRAISSFTDSLRVEPQWNPAVERIEALRRSQ